MTSRTATIAAIALGLAAGSLTAHAQDRRDDRHRNDRRMEMRHDDHDGWRRGGYVPRDYRDRHYVVDDWRGHRLHRPPRGYHWVQHGDDYVLAAIATGLISEIVAGSR